MAKAKKRVKRKIRRKVPILPSSLLFANPTERISQTGEASSLKWLVGRRSIRSELKRLDRLLNFEYVLWARSVKYVAGVDEVGLGALAGPVVAAAVVFPPHLEIQRLVGLNDSKKLTPLKREILNERIREQALSVGIGSVDIDEIAKWNVFRAGQEAMRRALKNLTVDPEHVLIDGRPVPGIDIPHNSFVKGDLLDFSIAAASVVAKVYRDALMTEYGESYPEYGFARHKGYGTEAHWEALKTFGTSRIHRASYEKLRELGMLNESADEDEVLDLTV